MQPDALVPPFNLDAEESVLGAMMLSEHAVEACMDVLEGREFYRPTHGAIFRAILAVYGRRQAVDAITVSDELDKAGKLEEVGGAERVHELNALVPAAANVRHWANIVRETWLARGLIRTGQDIIRMGYERPGAIEDLFADADRRMIELQAYLTRHHDDVFNGAQLAEAFLEKTLNPPDETAGVRTPWPFLKPLQPSRLIVLGGYQGTGKTAGGAQFLKSGCEGGARVGFASIEMSKEDITERLISLFGVPSDQVQTGRVDDVYQDRLNEALVAINSWDFKVIDDETLQPADLRRHQRREKFDLLIVDHLHAMQIKDKKHEREEISEKVQQITSIAREFEIPVLLLAQLSRGFKDNPYPRPTRRDLFGASAIENNAAHIWFVWRKPDKMNQFGNEAEFIIDKNRFGPTGWQHMWFESRFVRFNHQTGGEGT